MKLWFALWCLVVMVGAHAQVNGYRFAVSAKAGVLEVVQPPNVLIDGAPARLSPGVRIKNPQNVIVMSASLVGQRLKVRYVLDAQGLVRDVWLLTPQEAEQVGDVTNIVFSSQADQPKTDDGKTPFNQLPGFPQH